LVSSDEEQLEVLKDWWDQNGNSLVIAVVVTVGAIFGYRGWEENVIQAGEAASAVYEDLATATDNIAPSASDEALRVTAVSLAETLKADHGDTTYAVFAAMRLAKVAVAQNDLDMALEELRWALDNVSETHLETTIRVRLSRVHMGLEDPTSALTLLVNHQPASGQVASFEEAKGDIFYSRGDLGQAREAYQKALENMSEKVKKPILELKLADLPLSASATQEPLMGSETETETDEEVTEDDDV
jgi:predicted negative regulator of RcsB-dependent stress response